MLRLARWGWLTLALLAAWPAAAGPLAERLRERWQIGQAEARAAGLPDGVRMLSALRYGDDPAETLLGMGASAISMFPDRIVQNEKNAGRYRMRLSQRQLPGAHGLLRSPDDCERAVVIADILCNRPADIALVRGTPGAMEELARFIDLGLVTLAGDMLCPTDATRPYARTIAALFDPYRAQAPNRFSSAV